MDDDRAGPGTPHPVGDITDVPGVLVGHAQRVGGGWATGVTVVVPPPGTVAGVDVRGGGPATHETDALAPGTLVDTVDAVVLTGGSTFGLASVHGVLRWCEEHGRGFDVGAGAPPAQRGVVPIVPAAALFDLGRAGDWSARPDAGLGYEAADTARAGPVGRGSVGAGTGALLANRTLKGGVGSAGRTLDGGFVVGALAVVNAAGGLTPGPAGDTGPLEMSPPDETAPGARAGAEGPLNTTLVVVATDARLDVAGATRTATAAHDGIARALSPAHTLVDGDVVFALATGGSSQPLDVLLTVALHAAAADVVALAIRDAVRCATDVEGVDVPTWGAKE